MESIILVLIIIGIFVGGYFVVSFFCGYLEKALKNTHAVRSREEKNYYTLYTDRDESIYDKDVDWFREAHDRDVVVLHVVDDQCASSGLFANSMLQTDYSGRKLGNFLCKRSKLVR